MGRGLVAEYAILIYEDEAEWGKAAPEWIQQVAKEHQQFARQNGPSTAAHDDRQGRPRRHRQRRPDGDHHTGVVQWPGSVPSSARGSAVCSASVIACAQGGLAVPAVSRTGTVIAAAIASGSADASASASRRMVAVTTGRMSRVPAVFLSSPTCPGEADDLGQEADHGAAG